MKRFSLGSVLLGALAGTLVGATGTVALLVALGAPPARESEPARRPPAAPAPREAPRRNHPTPTPTTRPDPSVTALATADVTRRVDPWREPRAASGDLRIPDFVRADSTAARPEARGDVELRMPDFMRSSPPPRCDFLPGTGLRVPDAFMRPGVTYECERSTPAPRRPRPQRARR